MCRKGGESGGRLCSNYHPSWWLDLHRTLYVNTNVMSIVFLLHQLQTILQTRFQENKFKTERELVVHIQKACHVFNHVKTDGFVVHVT